MKKIILGALIACCAYGANAQKYMTRSGRITFFSSTPMENIEALNNAVAGVLDSKTGDFVFQAPIKSFKFEKALMQEHFNESYMESDKFPKAEYKGKVTNIGDVNFAKDGSYTVSTSGSLTVHGVTRNVTLPATVAVKGRSATVTSKFSVRTADHKISIPKLMEGKVAKEIEVNVNCQMDQK
jgi:uncharacterized membrane protein